MSIRIFVSALAVGMLVLSPTFAAEIRVDVSSSFKPVDHAASGSLYGLAAEGWPADQWIAAIHPKNFTQMAPGGRQLPNGETTPVGDALVVAPIAERNGATITIRMPDTFSQFPYLYAGDEDWLARVRKMVAATVAADPPNIYAYEIWNEPDWNWKWGDFSMVWAKTFAAIRAIDPERPIMGPSISSWNEAWMRNFLQAAIASGTAPDVISWHELDPKVANDLGLHVAAYRALEQELGIGPLPISINEYGAPRDSAVPGALARFVARLERAGVDTANLAFWHKPGRLADLVAPIAGGRGPAIEAEPTGAFWVYKWYGDMSGQMLDVTPDSGTGATLDGFASFDAASNTVRVVVGGEDGDHTVTVAGLEGFGAAADMQVFATHWTGTDGAMTAPEPLFAETLPIEDGSISVPITGASSRDAFLILVTPAGQAAPWTEPVPRFKIRLEAEDATLTGARKFPIRMAPGNFFAPTVSNDAYVGLLDREAVSVAFTVEVPTAGVYELSFGYSNGLADTATYYVSVPGSAEAVPVRFTPTQFRELMDQAKLTVMLPAGISTITLSAGPDSPHVYAPLSLIEIDYLDISANQTQKAQMQPAPEPAKL
jgi:hypothetical protein